MIVRKWVLLEDKAGNCALFHKDGWYIARFLPAVSSERPKTKKRSRKKKGNPWEALVESLIDERQDWWLKITGEEAEALLYDEDGNWDPSQVPDDRYIVEV